MQLCGGDGGCSRVLDVFTVGVGTGYGVLVLHAAI